MTTESEAFAERYVREKKNWKEYQRNRIENNQYEGNWSDLVTDLNRIMAGVDSNQMLLSEF